MPTKEVDVRIDRHLSGFRDEIPHFLRRLAALIEIAPGEISVVDIRSGCVILHLELQEEAAEKLLRLFRDRDLGTSRGDFFSWESVESVRETTLMTEKGVVLRTGFTEGLDWLHLSDLHVEAPTQPGALHDWMKDFLLDLPELLRQSNLKPRAILVSGDVAYSANPEEYKLAATFLEEVQDAVPQSVRTVIVPGNHDVQWATILPQSEAELRRAVKNEGPDPILERSIEGDLHVDLGERTSEFEKFVSTFLPPLQRLELDYARVWRFEVDDLEVGVAGLNSAILSTRGDLLDELGLDADAAGNLPQLDLQNLALGRHQLREAYEQVKQCGLRIAIMHHPPFSDWFHEVDRGLQRGWLSRFDFIHRGHEHVPSGDFREPVAVEDGAFEVAVGALHTLDDRYRGFAAVSLHLERQAARIVNWAYSGPTTRWHLDTLVTAGGDDYRILPKSAVERMNDHLSKASLTRAAGRSEVGDEESEAKERTTATNK